MKKYVHGYTERENQRLGDQAFILEELLHAGTAYPSGSRVLEAGCGVGAQTLPLARNSPGAEITSIDISGESLSRAKEAVAQAQIGNVSFRQANIMALPFTDESFEHIFICFVLEHLEDPPAALVELKRVLRKGGNLTVIEGDHGSCFWHPSTESSRKVWQALSRVQRQLGHNPFIGRELPPLLTQAGFKVKDVSPRWLYGAALNGPALQEGLDKIFVPMVETAREQALEQGLVGKVEWERGIKELRASGEPPDGTFFYTRFKGIALK